MKTRILIIDDDRNLQQLLCSYLEANAFLPESAFRGVEGIDKLRANGAFDIVILDIMLPDLDGFDTLRRIRELSAIPVIMLTARDDETDRVVGLEMGADDYMHKPFNPRELTARIKAVLRRTRAGADGAGAPLIRTGEIVIDPLKRSVWKGGEELFLSAAEFEILHELAASNGHVLTRDHLMNVARGRDFEAFDRSIDVHISRIRKKIEDDPSKPRRIVTVWGRGYKWQDG